MAPLVFAHSFGTPFLRRFIRPLWKPQHKRDFILSSLHPVLVPPVVFTGLVVTLWAYKCAMMVLFQNKIIYMPGIPIGSRHEKIQDYKKSLRGIEWKEERIFTSDGKKLVVAVAEAGGGGGKARGRDVVVVYFQGNAGSTPARLPFLSQILSSLSTPRLETESPSHTKYIFLALSYRGYWTSTGRPSQDGIEKDLSALFALLSSSSISYSNAKIVLWGQSIGCGIALQGLANYLCSVQQDGLEIAGMILETPFLSIKDMLITLYPQKYLPYRYLGPFLTNHWDVSRALSRISKTRGKVNPMEVLVLQAEKDELVPGFHSEAVEELFVKEGGYVGGIKVTRKVVRGALHVECMLKARGLREVERFLKNVARE